MADTAFRRLDVDQYDEDRVLETDLYEPDPRAPAQTLADTQSKAATSRQSLQRGDLLQALVPLLDQAPYGEGVDQAKSINLSGVVSVLNSTKNSQISEIVQQLDFPQQVTLMKYLYKAMENLGETSGNVILGWHEKLVEIGGTGCIVRVMTDRRRV